MKRQAEHIPKLLGSEPVMLNPMYLVLLHSVVARLTCFGLPLDTRGLSLAAMADVS